jgi:hypothetical protein
MEHFIQPLIDKSPFRDVDAQVSPNPRLTTRLTHISIIERIYSSTLPYFDAQNPTKRP